MVCCCLRNWCYVIGPGLLPAIPRGHHGYSGRPGAWRGRRETYKKDTPLFDLKKSTVEFAPFPSLLPVRYCPSTALEVLQETDYQTVSVSVLKDAWTSYCSAELLHLIRALHHLALVSLGALQPRHSGPSRARHCFWPQTAITSEGVPLPALSAVVFKLRASPGSFVLHTYNPLVLEISILSFLTNGKRAFLSPGHFLNKFELVAFRTIQGS